MPRGRSAFLKLDNMADLYIQNFSCIDDAHLRLTRMTVLIGPQASGKSVISKLMYFFYDILSRQIGLHPVWMTPA
jgi:predicted ATPase